MTSRSPRITVAIPFFDEARYLAAAVRSVLRQTFHDFELLLIDDGSTDSSLAIARSFDDPRIRVVSDGVRRGLPARLNEIVRRARGELVARMDGDDVSHPDRLARQLALLEREPECAAVGSWAALVDARECAFAVVEALLPGSPRTALERGLLPHATMLARRDWLATHPYDERLTRAEDRDLWCRTVTTTRFAVVPEPLYVVRVRANDPDFLSDYLESQRQNRMLLSKHGPRLVGRPTAARAWLASHAKSLAMRAATRAGHGERLVRRRGRPPTAAETALVAAALNEKTG